MHKLAALRRLADGMTRIEAQRKEAIELLGKSAPEVDRYAAQYALTGVVAFFVESASNRSRSCGC
jgi:hypothetical protein